MPQLGVCAVCRLPVHDNQARNRNQQGAYVHAQCVAGAVRPPEVQSPDLNDVKGLCAVCRMPVFVHQARSRNQWGAYVHAQCVAGAGGEMVGVAGVAPPVAPKPELKDVKGICDVCGMPVFVDQARSKNQRGAYVHAQCVSGANLTQAYQQIASASDPAQRQVSTSSCQCACLST